MIPAREMAEGVARRSYGKLVAYLAARTRDLAAAEDALSEAFTAALATWPRDGCPDNPEAWLLTVARRKAIDAERRKHESGGEMPEGRVLPETDQIPDRRLALLFVCAHPAIDEAIRAPLMLQTVMGLDAARVASAFLMAPEAMGKRLVRAKQKIRLAGIPFDVPGRDELPGRLDSVLQAIYAAYGQGWGEEAIFLARLVAELLPGEAEALGLASLVLHAEARRRAQRDVEGEFVPLAEQDRGSWDWQMIREAEDLLRRASTLKSMGRFQLEAAIHSAHVHRLHTGIDNWAQIVQLYEGLYLLAATPVIAVNRAMAIAEARGAAEGLAAMRVAGADPRLCNYAPYWAGLAELLSRTRDRGEARQAYDRAIGLECDPALRRYLARRRDRPELADRLQ